jgi:hypothetical protein
MLPALCSAAGCKPTAVTASHVESAISGPLGRALQHRSCALKGKLKLVGFHARLGAVARTRVAMGVFGGQVGCSLGHGAAAQVQLQHMSHAAGCWLALGIRTWYTTT